jgi:hypothetical protein
VKIFSQNSLIPIQILNGFLIFYCATWVSFRTETDMGSFEMCGINELFQYENIGCLK